MPEELQSLLERIQEDGVEKAEQQANDIISDAQNKASQIIAEAETNAEKTISNAKKDAEAYSERAKQSLAHAARDVILSVGQALDRILSETTASTVSDAIAAAALENMLVKAVETYCDQSSAQSKANIFVNEKDQKAVTDFLLKQYQDKLKGGIRVGADNGILGGFRISAGDDKVQHDFSSEAIADAISQLVRPQLAEIVRKAAQQDPS